MTLQRDTSVGYVTNLAGRLLIRALEKRLQPLGLTPAYMPVLLRLQDSPATQKQLAEVVGVEQPTMTATLNRMERDGWVERLPNPEDKRSTIVCLTEKALTNLRSIGAIVAEVNDAALGDFTQAERAQYFDLLGRVIAQLEEDVRKG